MIFFLAMLNLVLVGVLTLVWGRGALVLEKSKTPGELSEPHLCPVWETQLVQMKMIDAGIIDEREVSVCTESSCPGCTIVRKAAGHLHKREADDFLRNRQYLKTTVPPAKYIEPGTPPEIVETEIVTAAGRVLARICPVCGTKYGVVYREDTCKRCNNRLEEIW